MERHVLVFLVLCTCFASSVSSYCDDDYDSDSSAPVVDTAAAPAPASSAGSYIAVVDLPKGEKPQHFTIRILASILGSEEAATKALIRVYDYAFSGFEARLSPREASALMSTYSLLETTIVLHCSYGHDKLLI
ncbi:unnamed protein product [Musa acuminata subsp. malaccensis]|uniref:(wild Malaysian banana) hypothetical protein n=1 Tax=Musa acuminata subsp. malaccensis TaxID=214687 RepID=A0A804KWR0_MUSAM|nr:unnamed protein product [Musa acuminata subsp. malaccensis]